jgi:integrase
VHTRTEISCSRGPTAFRSGHGTSGRRSLRLSNGRRCRAFASTICDTHASLLAKAGVPIEVVSQRLGHSAISITVDRYITVYRERDQAAADAFDRLVS